MKKVPDPNPAGQKSPDPTGSGSSSLLLYNFNGVYINFVYLAFYWHLALFTLTLKVNPSGSFIDNRNAFGQEQDEEEDDQEEEDQEL